MKTVGISRNPLLIGVICLISIMQIKADSGWAPWDIREQSHQLILKNDYKGLDALAASLKAKGYDIQQDNKTEIDGFYEGLKISDEDSDQSQQNRLELLQEWVNCRLAIAVPGTNGAIGTVVATIPARTHYTPFVFEAGEDYPSLLLRINSPTFNGPGKVVYSLEIEAPSN